MAKRLHLIQHNTLDSIHAIIKKTQSLEKRYRLLAIEKIYAFPHITSKQICKELFINKATFFKWLNWYNEGGIKKLFDGEGGKGNKKDGKVQYPQECFDDLGETIEKDQERVWSLNQMQVYLKEKYDVSPTLQTIYYRIKEHYSYKSSRPYPKEADRDALGRFKKTE